MNDYSPRGAREHVSRVGRGAVEAEHEALEAQSLFAADDALFTRPVPIIAERKLADSSMSLFPFVLGTGSLAAMDGVSAERILHRFATRGGSLYDVTDEDGSGRSQELVGAWLAAARPAKALTLLTATRAGREGELGQPQRIVRAVDEALQRLGRSCIDLLMLELDAADLEIGEQLTVADDLVAAGKVRFVGAARASGDELLEARVLAGNGLPRIVAVRLSWDITDRGAGDAGARMVAAAQELALLPDATGASLALASPSLPQKVLAGWGHGARLSQLVNERMVSPGRERAADVLAGRGRGHRIGLALDRVSAELAVPPATTQLAWLLAKRGVVAPIVRVTRPEQLDPLMDAAAVRLTRAQMLELDRAAETPR